MMLEAIILYAVIAVVPVLLVVFTIKGMMTWRKKIKEKFEELEKSGQSSGRDLSASKITIIAISLIPWYLKAAITVVIYSLVVFFILIISCQNRFCDVGVLMPAIIIPDIVIIIIFGIYHIVKSLKNRF